MKTLSVNTAQANTLNLEESVFMLSVSLFKAY